MNFNDEHNELLIAQGEAHLIPGQTPAGTAPSASPAPRKMGFGQRSVVALLLTVVLVPPTGRFLQLFSGVPLHLLASSKPAGGTPESAALLPSLAGSGSTSYDPGPGPGLHRSGNSQGRARRGRHRVAAEDHAAARASRLHGARSHPPGPHPCSLRSGPRGRTGPGLGLLPQERTDGIPRVRPGDSVSKGDLLGVFYSVDVGSKKNDLLQALVQLELDQAILDRVEKNRVAIPEVMYLTYVRSVQGDRTEINRALNNLKLWDIPQDEIDALQAEAKKISADKDAWSKTPEGRWVNRREAEGRREG